MFRLQAGINPLFTKRIREAVAPFESPLYLGIAAGSKLPLLLHLHPCPITAHLGQEFALSSSQLGAGFLSPPHICVAFRKLNSDGHLLPRSQHYLASLGPSPWRNGVKNVLFCSGRLFLLPSSLSPHVMP